MKARFLTRGQLDQLKGELADAGFNLSMRKPYRKEYFLFSKNVYGANVDDVAYTVNCFVHDHSHDTVSSEIEFSVQWVFTIHSFMVGFDKSELSIIDDGITPARAMEIGHTFFATMLQIYQGQNL